MNLNYFTKYIFIFVIGLFTVACGSSEIIDMPSKQSKAVDEKKVENELVADGFDLISFFELENAVKGSPEISLVYEGVKLYFSNEENKQKFISNAKRYLPTYDEFCPVSLYNGKLIKGKPKYNVVYKDKLYFFYSKKYADEFEKDPEKFLKEASKTWEDSQNK